MLWIMTWTIRATTQEKLQSRVYHTQAIKLAYFQTGYWTSSLVAMVYNFPQTRTEKSLIQLWLKVTTRKRTGSYIIFFSFECCLSPFYLKSKNMYYKVLLMYRWPSKTKFPWLTWSKWGYHPLRTGSCGGTTATEHTWRCRNLIFSPITWPFVSLPANTEQCGVKSAQLSTQ